MDAAVPPSSDADDPLEFEFPVSFPGQCTIPECKDVVTSPQELLEHEEKHSVSKDRQHVCYKDHQSFSSPQALQIHLNSRHLGIKLHICDKCGTGYSDPSRRSRCLKSHEGRFCCSKCDYVNARKELVQRHIKSKRKGHPNGALIIFDPSKGTLSPPPEASRRSLNDATADRKARLRTMVNMSRRYNVRRIEALADHFVGSGHLFLAQVANLHAQELADGLPRTSCNRGPRHNAGRPTADPVQDAFPTAMKASQTPLGLAPSFEGGLATSSVVGAAGINTMEHLQSGRRYAAAVPVPEDSSQASAETPIPASSSAFNHVHHSGTNAHNRPGDHSLNRFTPFVPYATDLPFPSAYQALQSLFDAGVGSAFIAPARSMVHSQFDTGIVPEGRLYSAEQVDMTPAMMLDNAPGPLQNEFAPETELGLLESGRRAVAEAQDADDFDAYFALQ